MKLLFSALFSLLFCTQIQAFINDSPSKCPRTSELKQLSVFRSAYKLADKYYTVWSDPMHLHHFDWTFNVVGVKASHKKTAQRKAAQALTQLSGQTEPVKIWDTWLCRYDDSKEGYKMIATTKENPKALQALF